MFPLLMLFATSWSVWGGSNVPQGICHHLGPYPNFDGPTPPKSAPWILTGIRVKIPLAPPSAAPPGRPGERDFDPDSGQNPGGVGSRGRYRH